jgi:hypothetical protein
MRCLNANKFGQPQRKLMKEIVNYFQVNFLRTPELSR